MRSLNDSLNYLNTLEEEFGKLKNDCGKIQKMNQEMHGNMNQIENHYMRKSFLFLEIKKISNLLGNNHFQSVN